MPTEIAPDDRIADGRAGPSVAQRTRRLSTPALFALVLVAGAAPRVWLAFNDDGIYWPDELAKSLEQAHRLVFGYGDVPWEFVRGAVNWTFPALLAVPLRIVTWLGLNAPSQYLVAMRLLLAGLSIITGWGAYRLARACGAGPKIAVLGALFFLWSPAAIYFSNRALSEVVSAAPVVWGLALCLGNDDPRAPAIHRMAGALLIGFSVLLRLQNAVFAVALLVALACGRRWRAVLEAAASLAVCAVLLGAIDAVTWHGWFHSAITYLDYNVVHDGATSFGVSPPWFYFAFFWRSMGISSVVIGMLAIAGIWRAPALAWCAAAFLGVHSAIGHKEARFIFADLPVICALAAVGAAALHEWLTGAADAAPRSVRRRVGRAVWSVGLACALTASATAFYFWHDLSWRDVMLGFPAGSSAYDGWGHENRLLFVAYRQPDLCGIRDEDNIWAWTGGYVYLHRRVPFYDQGGPAPESGFYNYTLSKNPHGGVVIATQGDVMLKRIRENGCVRDPRFRPAVRH